MEPWECPRCHVIHAPWVPKCSCKQPQEQHVPRGRDLIAEAIARMPGEKTLDHQNLEKFIARINQEVFDEWFANNPPLVKKWHCAAHGDRWCTCRRPVEMAPDEENGNE